jgi:hypothetical protein
MGANPKANRNILTGGRRRISLVHFDFESYRIIPCPPAVSAFPSSVLSCGHVDTSYNSP